MCLVLTLYAVMLTSYVSGSNDLKNEEQSQDQENEQNVEHVYVRPKTHPKRKLAAYSPIDCGFMTEQSITIQGVDNSANDPLANFGLFIVANTNGVEFATLQ